MNSFLLILVNLKQAHHFYTIPCRLIGFLKIIESCQKKKSSLFSEVKTYVIIDHPIISILSPFGTNLQQIEIRQPSF